MLIVDIRIYTYKLRLGVKVDIHLHYNKFLYIKSKTMNMLRNQVQLIGRIGSETELKTLDSGNNLLNLSIATNEFYKDKDGVKQEKTEWHRIVAWGKTAEIMNNLIGKGDEIAIEGKLTHRSYEKDGETRYSTEVVVNEFLLLNSVNQK